MRKLLILTLLVLAAATASALQITAPQAGTYNDTTIPVNVTSNETLESLSYALDGGNATTACTNCSGFQGELILAEGQHTLSFTGTAGNDTYEDEVSFTINLTQTNDTEQNETTDFTLTLTPTGTIEDDETTVKAQADQTLDTITLEAGGQNATCTGCDELELELDELADGTHTISATGTLGNLTKIYNESFTVNAQDDDENETDEDEENETAPRFSIDQNMLPKDVEIGLYTDAELAEIIRTNNLNPGVVNRLIKTGMLGNESIEALLEYDFQPRGVFGKLFYKLGFKGHTHVSRIAKRYTVNESVQAKIANHGEASNKQAKVAAKTQAKSGQPADKGKDAAPGQAKKNDEQPQGAADEQNGKPADKGKAQAPGQAKKN